MMIEVLILKCVVMGVMGTTINHELLSSKSQQYEYIVEDSINVTLGESFKIILPSLDIKEIPSNYSVYEITQETFLNWFEIGENHQNPTQVKKEKRKRVSADTFHCQLNQPKMQIKKTLGMINEANPSSFSSSFTTKKYVFIYSQNLIYSLDPFNMELSVLHYNEQSIKELSSIRLPLPHQMGLNKAAIASTSNESKILVFTSLGMWSIETKTYLTKVEKMSYGQDRFNSEQQKVDDLIHGYKGFMIGIEYMRSVYLIEQRTGEYIVINSFNETQIAPQNVYLEQGYIYILDLHKGVYVYKLLGNGKVIEHDSIELNTFGNINLIVKQKSLFVNYNDQSGNKIIEINYDPERKVAELVRYYKDDQFITSMMIGLGSLTSPSISSENSKEQFLFLTADNGQVEIYPFNIDPTTIQSLHNGVKMYVDGIRQIFNVFSNYFILITNIGIQYVQIEIRRPELVCSMHESTGHSYYQVQLATNISSCEHFDHQIAHKEFYNSRCELLSTYTIYIDDPDRSEVQKILLYGIVMLVIVAFVVGLLCLIEWRNNKLSLLGRLKDEIIRFRDRHRRMQPFVEEERINKEEVEFELPKSEPIDDIVE